MLRCFPATGQKDARRTREVQVCRSARALLLAHLRPPRGGACILMRGGGQRPCNIGQRRENTARHFNDFYQLSRNLSGQKQNKKMASNS